MHAVDEVLQLENRQGLRFPLAVARFVLGAKGRVGQHFVGFLEEQKLLDIARLGIVWMKARSHYAVDAVNGFGLGLPVNLKNLVVVGFVCRVDFVAFHRAAQVLDTLFLPFAGGVLDEVLFRGGSVQGFDHDKAARAGPSDELQSHRVARDIHGRALAGHALRLVCLGRVIGSVHCSELRLRHNKSLIS